MPTSVTWVVQGTVLLVSLAGTIDATALDLLETLLRTTGPNFKRALVDLGEVTFFGGVGVNFLARLAATGASVQLVAVPEWLPMGRQLQAVGLGQIISA